VTIPLAKLVNVQPLWKHAKALGSRDPRWSGVPDPIGDDLYEFVRTNGDTAEAGRLDEVTPEMVSNLRGLCWAMITRLCIEADFFSVRRNRAAPELTADALKIAVYNTAALAAGFLLKIDVRPTDVAVIELITEVASRLPDEEVDRTVPVTVHVLDSERDYLRNVIGDIVERSTG
jgi:hypothetical protein